MEFYLRNKTLLKEIHKVMISYFFIIVSIELLCTFLLEHIYSVNIFYISLVRICVLVFGMLFLTKKILKVFSTQYRTDLSKEKTLLSYKIASQFTANIDHQLKTPLVAIQQGFDSVDNFIQELVKCARPTGNRDIDRIVYGCNEKTIDCKNCTLQNTEFCKGKKVLLQEIQKINYNIDMSIKNMFLTLNLIKSVKNSKNRVSKNKTIYNTVQEVISMFNMLNKYKYKSYIDKELNNFILTTITPVEFLNVINNHIQNSLDANASIIKVKFNSFKNNKLSLFIIDNGIGIPKELVNNVWELHQTSKGEGRGFGMFYCKQIIIEAGGEEKIISSEKNGTIIEIIIPAKEIK